MTIQGVFLTIEVFLAVVSTVIALHYCIKTYKPVGLFKIIVCIGYIWVIHMFSIVVTSLIVSFELNTIFVQSQILPFIPHQLLLSAIGLNAVGVYTYKRKGR